MEIFKKRKTLPKRNIDYVKMNEYFMNFLNETGCSIRFTPYDEDIFYLPDGSEKRVFIFQTTAGYINDCQFYYQKWKNKQERKKK